jgi:Cu(I)/Ag(I) efflux system membrane fusion protein
MKTRLVFFLCITIAFAAGIGVHWLLPASLTARGNAEASAVPPASSVAKSSSTYYCPMHPSYRSEHPGNCPICNMTLIPLEAGSVPEDAATVEGHATVTIPSERQQWIGVESARVERKPAKRTIRAAGRVEFDERKLSAISLKYGGWIEELQVKSTGESVVPGAQLFSIYSPELYEAQRVYALARAGLQAGAPGVVGQELAESARQKLLLWDMTEEQLAALEAGGAPERVSVVHSKARGVVTRREVVAGARVEPGAVLYELAELSSVWIHAEIYETEISVVHVGAEATIALEALPGERLRGTIVYVYPSLDPTTRTARVRLELDNADGKLKPGMYGTVLIGVDLGEQLVIDDEAILDTGRRKLVFVDLGEGRFEPREVTLGHRGDGQAVVLEGLEENERVVTSGNFLVDSESRLKAALHGIASTPGEGAGSDGEPVHQHP